LAAFHHLNNATKCMHHSSKESLRICFFFFFFFFNKFFFKTTTRCWFVCRSLWCKPMEARSLLATRVVEFCSSRLLSVPFLFCFLFWFFSYRSFTSSRLRGMDVLGVSATKAFWQCFLGDFFLELDLWSLASFLETRALP